MWCEVKDHIRACGVRLRTILDIRACGVKDHIRACGVRLRTILGHVVRG